MRRALTALASWLLCISGIHTWWLYSRNGLIVYRCGECGKVEAAE